MSSAVPARPPQAGPSQGHSSRRDNYSVSSTHSSSGRERTRERAHPAMESAVTRLLVSIKALLESLTKWSEQNIDEIAVSDVYVQFGNDFNTAVAAFASFNIDMTELVTVPDELRVVLEQCLSEDATPDNLDIYLPNVRKIITNLLQGLREKQTIYRKIMTDHRRQMEGHERPDSRSSRSRREMGHRPESTRTSNGEDGVQRDSVRRSGHTSTKRRDIVSQGSQGSAPPTTNGDEQQQQFIGGFAPIIIEENTPPPDMQPLPPPPVPDSISSQHARQPSIASSTPEPPESEPAPAEAPVAPVKSPIPAHVKRYSLVDKPVTPSVPVVIEPSSPETPVEQTSETSSQPSESTPIENVPAVADSLAALKKSDVLERRASKRFSTYNISKITNSGVRSGSLRGHPNRRSLAASNALTPGELAVLTEVDDEEAAVPETGRRSRSASRPTTPAIPPLPTTPSRTPEPKTVVEAVSKSTPSATPGKVPVFLQLGREVKKVSVEPGLSFSGLRMLFVDKFAYNPGLENFPAIYIRDPSSGVQYELEDVDEVKEKCLLSLNIEPLDQIKQHIDTQISSLHQDIKDLKTAISNNQRASMQLSHIVTQPLAESTPVPRPTDRQFQSAARRLSRFVGDSPFVAQSFGNQNQTTSPTSTHVFPQVTGQSLQAQMTGASAFSDYTIRVVTDLRTQFDEVQNLRRDIGVMRQLYTEFMKQTKDSLGALRNQTQNVKQLANSSVGGARAYIDSGKQKLDIRSQNVLTDVEKLQDLVENIRDDVTKRQITPKPQYFKSIKNDVERVAAELESLKEHIKTIKPMWKKTWEEELQNIVEEQQFLNHQEEFLADLLEDHKAVVEVYGHVEQVANLRGANGAPRSGRRGYRPPPPDEGHNGLTSVMQEIRGATAIDHERRLKAIEASQKNREKELATRSDDLQAELSEFVGQKKLKLTGGAEEAERVRQRRNDMTLKAMFTGGSVSSFNSTSANGSSPTSPSMPLG